MKYNMIYCIYLFRKEDNNKWVRIKTKIKIKKLS